MELEINPEHQPLCVAQNLEENKKAFLEHKFPKGKKGRHRFLCLGATPRSTQESISGSKCSRMGYRTIMWCRGLILNKGVQTSRHPLNYLSGPKEAFNRIPELHCQQRILIFGFFLIKHCGKTLYQIHFKNSKEIHVVYLPSSNDTTTWATGHTRKKKKIINRIQIILSAKLCSIKITK